MGGGTGKCTAKCHHQCHTSGLQWPAPRGTPGVHQWHWPCTKRSSPSQCQCPAQHHHQDNCHGAQGGTTTRHAQRQASHAQAPIQLGMSMHHCHGQGRLGATPNPSASKPACPHSISQSTRSKPQGLAPSMNQPLSTTKWGGWSCRLCSGDTS